jgi:hypothetical protein
LRFGETCRKLLIVCGVLLLLGLEGCGYVGPVLPPSPQLPLPVADLTVVERGDQLVISFSTPARTVDNLAVKQFSELDLRIGPDVRPFDFDRWKDSATRYELAPPPPADPDNPLAVPISKNISAAGWVGKRVTVAVRTAIKKNDHYSAWSNRVVLDVIAPLRPPSVKEKSTAKGVELTWESTDAALEYRIYRKGPDPNPPVQLGISKTNSFLDTTSQYETPYEYTIVAVRANAESLPSRPVQITTKDIFPPSVPASVTALAAPNSIEVSWQRSPEADLKGYLVYRSVNGGAFEPIGSMLNLPTFSDLQVEHGKTYAYRIAAVDQKNNTSDRSAPAQVRF